MNDPGPSERGRGAATRIRRAVPGDARAIAVISTLGWQQAYRGMLPDQFLDRLNVEGRERGWRMALENQTDDSPVWIVERANEPVGFVSSGPPRDEDLTREIVEIYAIYVLPAAWRSGIGRLLIETATHDAAERGARGLSLWVLEANDRGRRFYEAMGWRPDGGRQLFEFADVSAPEVRYRLDLPPDANAVANP